MILTGFWPVFFGGVLGGVLVELMKLGTSGYQAPEKYRRPWYWVTTVALWIASGLAVAINGIQDVPIQTAVQLGITAPALVSGWASGRSGRKRKAASAPGKPTKRGAFLGTATSATTSAPTQSREPASVIDMLGF